MLIVVHELSHCATAELLGGNCYGIGFNWEKFYAYARISCSDIICWRATLMAGSFVAGSISCIMSYISLKREKIGLYIVSSIYLIGEFVYWAISPIIKIGDAHMLISGTEVDIVSFCAIFFVMSIYLFVKTLIGCEKIWEKKMILKKY